MIPQIGYLTLIFAFTCSFLQLYFAILLIYRKKTLFQYFTFFSIYAQSLLITLSFFILIYLFFINDFSVIYVAQHSNSNLPWYYRICAVWSAHEGSLFLWIFVLNMWIGCVAFFNKHLPPQILGRIISVLATLSIIFYWFLFAYSHPFSQYWSPPLQGKELNPILQDVGLEIHPPLLYIGYVGFSVVFAFACASLWSKELNFSWAKWMQPWVKAAWCFLTLGIVLGSWWAYRELGWGGFWFWDPVENASLMPWLVATALLHVLAIEKKRSTYSLWTIFLSLMVFSLCLLGTFLVRSGILISVHTFSNDPNRGIFLLKSVIGIIGGAFLLFAYRAKFFISHEKISFDTCISAKEFNSHAKMILINNILLFIAMLIILIGTLYPLIMSVLNLGKISVGAPYFNIVLSPILILLLFFMLFSLKYKIKNFGMWIAHLGVLVTVIGILCSSAFSQEKSVSMKVGEKISISGYQFILKNITSVVGKNYKGFQATILVKNNHRFITTLFPQLRLFPSHILLPKAAISASFFYDIYITLGNPLPKNEWMFQINVKPFVRWVWVGGIMMLLGAVMTFFRRSSFKESHEKSVH